jgi:hypothetical protein
VAKLANAEILKISGKNLAGASPVAETYYVLLKLEKNNNLVRVGTVLTMKLSR